MKKQYISPVCEVIEVKIGNLLGGSVDIPIEKGDGNIDLDDIGDGGIGGGSHGDFWGD